MSFLIYQRSDPRYSDWLPLTTQQVRLRNLIQVIGLNFDPGEDDQLYYTLHLAPMSAPFYTSEKVRGGTIVSWREIEPRQIPSYVPLSATGFVIRIWSSSDGSKPLTSWGVKLRGLHFLGSKGEWNTQGFDDRSIVFRMPFGFFTSHGCLLFKTKVPERFVSFEYTQNFEACRNSYSVKGLTELHSFQRSVLEELEVARILRNEISSYGFSSESDITQSSPPSYSAMSSLARLPSLPKTISQFATRAPLSNSVLQRVQQGRSKLQLREAIETKKFIVTFLREEKMRSEGRVHRLKQTTISVDDTTSDLMTRIHALGRDRERLREIKTLILEKKAKLAETRNQLNTRKKQLISELLLIYPMQLVEGSQRFSISEVQLPDAEDYGSESGGQVSVALGYTAHLVAMLGFFLGIPLRYPIRHFGSRSRIIDHITAQIPNKDREFPLYFRGREDVYSKYAVYLLNKNIAQLRWYCGLSTQNLRATLPNLYNVLTSRLTIPGWPPSPTESCEIAEELTEETHQQLFRNDMSLSLDGGLDQIAVVPPKPYVAEARMQSWLRSSFSDLEGVGGGGNAVPDGEIVHSRAQNRFLSGWKKKTYSESEDIDPRWLTNSLNLELDLGTRAGSVSPSPPMIVVSSNEAARDSPINKPKKRRVGRVEHSSVFNYNTCDNNSSGKQGLNISNNNNKLQIPEASSQSLTPNRSMNEIEQQIKENERRKSTCDMSWVGVSGSSGFQGVTSAPRQEFMAPDLPVVDNYSTTDEDRMDDAFADVVRRLSLMEMQLHRIPPTSSPSAGLNSTADVSSGDSVGTGVPALAPVQEPSGSKNDREGKPSISSNSHGDDNIPGQPLSTQSDVAPTGSAYVLQSIPSIVLEEPEDESPLQKQLDFFSTSDEMEKNLEGTMPTLLGKAPEQPELSQGTVEKGNGIHNDNAVNPTHNIIEKNNCDDLVTTRHKDIPTLFTERTCDKDLLHSATNHNASAQLGNDSGNSAYDDEQEDPSSLWFRTEALLTSQSFNLVKRRISESN